jgi:uncharacterized protein YjiS (DUF1127 family)
MTTFTDRIGHGPSTTYTHPSPLLSLWTAAGRVLGNFATVLLDWQERARQRRQLLALGDDALKDFGRNRADAASEGDKPFWRA